MKTRVTTVTCPDCKDEIFSRARHDYRTCKCGGTIVDGGFDYLKYGGLSLARIIKRVRYVNASRADLYQDWNMRINKFGRIQGASNAKA